MTAIDCLRRLRQDFLAGKHHMGALYFPSWALEDACLGDVEMATECMDRLDDVTPDGWTFCQFIDGAAWDGDEILYRHGRTKQEVAALMTRAADRSSNPTIRALTFQGATPTPKQETTP